MPKKKKDESRKYHIISRLNHPVTISYDGKGVQIPPRARKGDCPIEDKNKLGALPSGILIV